jgi:hypothetical protein
VVKNGGVVERQLSGASVESVKQAISDNRFFELQGFYPPKDGVADYFSYLLTVTMDGRAHSLSWVNERTLAEPVPKGLGMIVGTIQQEYDNASEPSMDNGKRRITETMVKQSASHNAEGHASHQAATCFWPSRLCLQWRAVTFTTNRSVDILVYHDVTD